MGDESIALWANKIGTKVLLKVTSVVSGYRARLEIQGSRVQTRLRSMDVLGRKNPEHKSSGRD